MNPIHSIKTVNQPEFVFQPLPSGDVELVVVNRPPLVFADEQGKIHRTNHPRESSAGIIRKSDLPALIEYLQQFTPSETCFV